MRPKGKKAQCIVMAVTFGLFICFSISQASAQLYFFGIDVQENFSQSSASGAPSLESYIFSVSGSSTNDYNNASLVYPGPGSPQSMTYYSGTAVGPNGSFNYSSFTSFTSNTSISSINFQYPFGTYTITASGASPAQSVRSLSYLQNSFPSVPVVGAASYTQLQGMNPAAPFVMNLAPFTQNSNIGSPSGNTVVDNFANISLYALGAVTSYSPKVTQSAPTQVTINSNTLLPDTTYAVSAGYSTSVVNLLGGVVNGFEPDTVVSFATSNEFKFTTGNAAPVQVLTDFNGGSPHAPVTLAGTGIAQVSGTIGGEGSADFYEFDWQGGTFTADASVTASTGSYAFELFNRNDDLIANVPLDTTNGFANDLDLDLASGAYIVGILANSQVDPPFTITFDTPVSGGSAVPEPGTWALLALGLTGLSLVRTIRRRGLLLGATPQSA